MSNSKLYDLAAELRHETERALYLFDGRISAWVPKSMVENNGDGTFTMPEWLAKNKGFL